MSTTFWSNTIWFILLGFTTFIQLVFILIKAKDRKYVLAMFFIICGMTFCIEATILMFFRAYNYYPLLLPHSWIDDNLAGNLFSQFSLTATSIIIAVLNLSYYWYFIFAGVYALVEELFLSLGIYTHNWYQTWMSFVGFALLFWFTKRLYQSRVIYHNKKLKYFYMLFGLYTLHMPTVLWIQILTGIIMPNTKFLSEEMSSYALICLLNLALLSFTCMYVYYARIKYIWKLLITVILYLIIFAANRLGLLYIKEGWFFIFASINIFGMYLSIFILDRLIRKTNHYRRRLPN